MSKLKIHYHWEQSIYVAHFTWDIEKLAWCLRCHSLTNTVKIIVAVWRERDPHMNLSCFCFLFFLLSLHYLDLHTYYCRSTLYAYTLRWQSRKSLCVCYKAVLFSYSYAPQKNKYIYIQMAAASMKWKLLSHPFVLHQ